ncbi:hypothetical protein [Segetibacter aerophilus]|uniref:Beta-lactamase-inhibitor-like PepSY-like domain-containing protein n=1 Tax=Segetibacter aerophilus TaxID=670293 RepID=A0A512BK14_9BACT|nr:hypothetical protein [Segetibacter aerophilus]GEO12235.1 hypothetical protein SAE01_47310 [Segetibacter aerophilus]
MKKLFLAALFAASLSSSFAQSLSQVDEKAVADFEVAFRGASNVEWSSKNNFTIASFIQNDRKVEVYYNIDGDFVATTHQVKMDDVPTFAKRTFAKSYKDYVVKEAFKFQGYDEVAYYISVENEKETLVLKAIKGWVEVYSRTSK